MQLDIFIPQSRFPEILQLGPDSALAGLLSKARLTRMADHLEAVLYRQIGLGADAGQSDDGSPPLALITCNGEDWADGGADIGSEGVLFADPVHLQLQRDSFSLTAPVPLPLTSTETKVLLDSLNLHFADDGLQFRAGGSGHWYLRTAQAPALTTQHPGRAIDRDIHAFLPQGPDAARWKHLSNEIQMLLHVHPVNQRREGCGLPVCNSLWFWGGGNLPRAASSGTVPVYGASPLIRGMGRLGLVTHAGLAPVADRLQETSAACWWLDGSSTIDHDLQLAAAMYARGKVRRLRLYLADRGEVLRAELKRPDLLRFWRRPRAVHTYFSGASMIGKSA